MREIISRGVKQTRDLAKKLAKKRGARIFALVGDLGAGKTTFSQAFIKTLGIKNKITSPTFLLIKKYQLKSKTEQIKKAIYHIDAYRIKKAEELIKLGFKKIINDKNSIILIEWADRVKNLIPKNAIWIRFEHGGKKNERFIKL